MLTATTSTDSVNRPPTVDADEEEVTLPTLPSSEPSLPTAPSFTFSNNRKRPFLRFRQPSSYEEKLTDAIHTSSDPALFSSDDTPDAENYSPGMKRRKKTYKGTWWGDNVGKARALRRESTNDTTKKKKFRRNFDSGIFMVDDSSGTDLSSDGFLEQELLRAQETEASGDSKPFIRNMENITAETKPNARRIIKFTTEAAVRWMPQSQPINPKDYLVRKVVQDCLDNNNENVDWSGLDLDSLPLAITDLKSMIKRINPEVANDKLAPFEAELKVFLANNDFQCFPQPLLELTNIQLLSVRQNKLTELPPGIRSLVNLRELNISSNSLQYLPFEVLQLLRYHELKWIREPLNPWLSVPSPQDRFTSVPALAILSTKKIALRRLAVSKPIEFHPDGSSRFWSSSKSRPSNAPHLSETVLRALLRHNTNKTDLSTYLSEHEHPRSAIHLLRLLHTAQSSGGRTCTFCSRDLILPRYQWYEWWDITRDTPAFHHIVELSMTRPDEHRDRSPWKQIYFEFSGDDRLLASNVEIEGAVHERILPFQRMACGCVDVLTGLRREVEGLRETGVPCKASEGAVPYAGLWTA